MFFHYKKTLYFLLVLFTVYSDAYAGGYQLGVSRDTKTVEITVFTERGRTKLFGTDIKVEGLDFIFVGKRVSLPKNSNPKMVPRINFDLVLLKKTKQVDCFNLRYPENFSQNWESPIYSNNKGFQNASFTGDVEFIQMSDVEKNQKPNFLFCAIYHNLLSTIDVVPVLNLDDNNKEFKYTAAIFAYIPISPTERNTHSILQKLEAQKIQVYQIQLQQIQLQQMLMLQHYHRTAPFLPFFQQVPQSKHQKHNQATYPYEFPASI